MVPACRPRRRAPAARVGHTCKPWTGDWNTVPVRPEHDRAQSCAIALRSPASERPSDLNRYSPDIHHQVRGAAQRHPAYPLILRLDGVPRHARLLACFHGTRKPSLAPSTTIPARGSPAPPSPSATLELAAAAKEHISGFWCQSRWCLAVPYTNSHMPYITRSALAVSKDTNSRHKPDSSVHSGPRNWAHTPSARRLQPLGTL